MRRNPAKLIVRPASVRGGLVAHVFVALVSQATAADYTLERVVLVSRHGVRAPTDSAKLVEFTRSKDWPKWLKE